MQTISPTSTGLARFAGSGAATVLDSIYTGQLHPSERIQMWEDAISRLADQDRGILFKPLDDGFMGQIDYITVGNWRLSRIAAGSHSLRVEPTCWSGSAPPLLVVLQRKGSCTLGRDNETIQVGAGEIAVAPLNEPLTLVSEQYIEQYILWGTAPQKEVGEQTPDVTKMRHMTGLTSIQGLLRSLVETLLAEMPAHVNASNDFLAPTISWLLAQSLWEPDAAQRPAFLAKLSRDRIVRYIEDNLHDSELSPERIARALGCSKRTLHRAFDSGSGDESVNRYLWRRRIERCAAELRSSACPGRRQTVTEIAYSFGFSSSAHFSRRFKQHIGVTPLRFRQVGA
ncbi:helix-turn-helix domain-containing protein [Variovorax boronicumulans]|uniref:helix-turn-helix domain-containing protein n=1 Tax=Variovorax boronicumulans TaxID=436515 RepID=UPI00339B4B16